MNELTLSGCLSNSNSARYLVGVSAENEPNRAVLPCILRPCGSGIGSYTALRLAKNVLISSLLVGVDPLGPSKTSSNAVLRLDYTFGGFGRHFWTALANAHGIWLRSQPVNNPDIWRSKTQPDIYQAVLKLLSGSFETHLLLVHPSLVTLSLTHTHTLRHTTLRPHTFELCLFDALLAIFWFCPVATGGLGQEHRWVVGGGWLHPSGWQITTLKTHVWPCAGVARRHIGI